MSRSNFITVQLRPHSVPTRASLLAGCAAIAILAAPTAFAQEAGPQAAEAEASTRIVVTGSRLRGVDEPVGSPVLQIGREAIELATVTSVDKLIQQTPQIFDLGISESSRAQNGGAGNIVYGAGINLRGLGPYATLVLVDGHRAISNGRSIDPSFLPSLGLERVEVLADGASAVYGSDAVAGVVNLIPRRFVNGGQFYARYGEGDAYSEHNIGLSFGETWDGGQIHLAYENGYRSGLNGLDRDYFRANQTARGGNDYRGNQCNPGNIVMGGVSYAIPVGGVTPGNAASLTAGTVNRCETLATQDLLPEQEYNSYALTFNQQLTPWLEFVADAFHTQRDFYRNVAFSTGNLTVPTTNAFYVAPVGVTPGPQTIQYNFEADGFRASTSGFAKNLQLTGGFVVKLPGDWRGEMLATYGENKDNSESFDGTNNGALNAALASSNPATAFDPYGLNRTTQAIRDAISNQIFLAPTNNELVGYEVRFDGPIFTLPGGQVRLAVGAERQEHDTHLGSARGNPGTPIVFRDFDRQVDSAYAEVFVPIFGAANAMPGFQRLELNIAGRVDDYSDVGSTSNPKLGVNWEPINDFTIRGSYGTSLRAPLFSELYGNSSNLFIQNYSDPTQGNASIVGAAQSGGNLALEPETATTFTVGFDYEPAFVPGLRFGMTYFDIEYEGQIAAYLSNLSILRNEADFAGTGIILRGQAAADRVAQLTSGGMTFVGVPPNPITLYVDGRPQNLGVSLMEGFDFTAGYGMDLMGGRLDLSVDGTYLTKFDTAITPNGTLLDKLDTLFNPLDFKIRTTAVWSNDYFRVNGSIAHVDGYTNDLVTPNQSVESFTTVDVGLAWTPGGDRLKGIMQGGFTVGLDVRNLLDEEPPYVNVAPNGNGSGGFDATAANPTGRVIGVSLRKHY